MRHSDTAWVQVGATDFSAGGHQPSLAIDAGGVLYVAYANDYKASVMRLASRLQSWSCFCGDDGARQIQRLRRSGPNLKNSMEIVQRKKLLE